jgi:hypothetical protein
VEHIGVLAALVIRVAPVLQIEKASCWRKLCFVSVAPQQKSTSAVAEVPFSA